MARNQEKAQSMLYRFREAQAAELGISLGRSKDQRRPRLASSVKDLRECEKWRGDVLREISRKVSKIQDFGLTDYEIRDLNDEINKLLREKNHWENQIIALGGANYKRSGFRMTDDAGREVPGSRGYKYFGRAKDLPGVKELLENAAAAVDSVEAQEAKASKYRRFLNQPPAYLGDEDEDDGVLLKEEEDRERKMWEDGIREIGLELGEDGDEETTDLESIAKRIGLPSAELPRRKAENIRVVMQRYSSSSGSKDKDVSDAATVDIEQEAGPDGKRKASSSSRTKSQPPEKKQHSSDAILPHLLPALDAEQVSTRPDVPDRKATEAFILRERKKMLKSEYLGEES